MGKADRISGAFWFIFSLFVSYQSYRLGLGSLHVPGPGFFFFWTGIFVAFLSLVVIMRSLKQSGGEDAGEGATGRSKGKKIVLVLVSLFLYALLIERLGFLFMTFVLFVFLLAVIERKRWSFAVVVGLLVTALSYLVFEAALQSQLPKGILEILGP